jgi:hypothetical protein
MRTLQIAAIAFFAFGSAAYAMGGGPYPHLLGQPDLHPSYPEGPAFDAAPLVVNPAPYVGYSAHLGSKPARRLRHGIRTTHGAESPDR